MKLYTCRNGCKYLYILGTNFGHNIFSDNMILVACEAGYRIAQMFKFIYKIIINIANFQHCNSYS